MLYNYKGFHNCYSVCRISQHGNLVICTELHENQGTSITNYAEGLANLVCRDLNINKSELIWIEHYTWEYTNQGNFTNNGTYALVTFVLNNNTLNSPIWYDIPNSLVNTLIKLSTQ